MKIVLDDTLLARRDIGDDLPPHLRPWLLNDQPSPRFVPGLGIAPILFVQTQQSWPCVRPCFAIPFQWRRGLQHDPLLPPNLHELADQVKAAAASRETSDASLQDDDWGLTLSEPDKWRGGRFNVDLRHLSATVDSGFASLLVSLLLAKQGLVSDPNQALVPGVGVRVPKHDFYLREVEGLKQKLAFANACNIPLFAPLAFHEAQQQGLPLEQALSLTDQAAQALHRLRSRLAGAPARDDPIDTLVTYYQTQSLVRRHASRFFCSHLLRRLDDLLQSQKVDHTLPRPDSASTYHLITIASEAAELPHLAVQLIKRLDVKLSCVSLVYSDPDQIDQELHTKLEKTIDVDLLQRSRLNDVGSASKHFASWRSKVIGPVIFDLTPGFKSASLAMVRAARRGDWLMYIQHDRPNGVVDPCSYRLWLEPATVMEGPPV